MPTTNLTLQVQPGSDALHRVVCVCRRRNLHILALTYAEHQITFTVSGGDSQVRGIEHWLSALLHVVDVRHSETSGSSGGARGVDRRLTNAAPGSTPCEDLKNQSEGETGVDAAVADVLHVGRARDATE